jgi:hypothetical protein
MKKNLFSLFLSLSFLISCTDHQLDPEIPEPVTSPTDLATSASSSVTNLSRFKASSLAIPSGGLTDSKQFYGGKLRASTAYNPYGLTGVLKNGIPRVRFFINPKSPSSYLTNTTYPHHHRAEFTRYPWWIDHPRGTEEWLGFSYIFPTTSEGFTQNRTPVSIYQNHAGSQPGQKSNPPALQLEIASPGQINSSDPWRGTPKGGEIMIINNVRGIRYVAQGVRVVPGARLDIVIQIVYDLDKKGLFNVWINGKLVSLPVGNIGSTIWPANPVGGNSKLGLYHHFMRSSDGVKVNAAKGHTKMEMFMSDWNDVIRKPGDWDYKNSNAFKAVSTAGYP